MALLEKICEELGVEIGEQWEGNDGCKYRISKNGEILLYDKKGFYAGSRGFNRWASIFNGDLKPMWKPKQYEKYYMPNLYHFNEEEKYDSWHWEGYEQEKWILENNMVFKTKEEAIEATNKMLKALKEE